jgi:hypothetical protein
MSIYYIIDLNNPDADNLLKSAHREYRRRAARFMPFFNVGFTKALLQMKNGFNRELLSRSGSVLLVGDEFFAANQVNLQTEWSTAIPPVDSTLVSNYLLGSGTLTDLLTALRAGG